MTNITEALMRRSSHSPKVDYLYNNSIDLFCVFCAFGNGPWSYHFCMESSFNHRVRELHSYCCIWLYSLHTQCAAFHCVATPPLRVQAAADGHSSSFHLTAVTNYTPTHMLTYLWLSCIWVSLDSTPRCTTAMLWDISKFGFSTYYWRLLQRGRISRHCDLQCSSFPTSLPALGILCLFHFRSSGWCVSAIVW